MYFSLYYQQTAIQSLTIDEAQNLLMALNIHSPRIIASLLQTSSSLPDFPQRVQPCPCPKWCHCDCCIPMDNVKMNNCCMPNETNKCLSTCSDFLDLCLRPITIEVTGILNYANNFHDDPTFANKHYRHQAYIFFILWQHGHLGMHERRRIPACIVSKIRWLYPDDNGLYTGYMSSSDIDE